MHCDQNINTREPAILVSSNVNAVSIFNYSCCLYRLDAALFSAAAWTPDRRQTRSSRTLGYLDPKCRVRSHLARRFWARSPAPWRVALAVPLFALACLLSWTAVRALGRQWRFDAGVNEDHELVRSGPYRFVRHPIYTSIICLFLGTGLLVARWPLLLVSFVLLIVGTQIRVRTEDRLLESHFGEALREYRREVPAYIPLLKRRP
jgi:protein-S-isoprenylcysteine O-methyltransferase Ste14